MNESQEKPEGAYDERPSNPSGDDPLKPFHEASMKFLQATMEAHQATMKDSAQAYLDFQQSVRKVEQETYEAIVEATRNHMKRMSEQPTGKAEDVYSTRLQSQMNYENEVRQVYTNAQSKVQEVAQKFFGGDGGDVVKRLASQRQDAYQTYLADLQRAWSGVASLDPQAVKAVASNILCTLNVC